MRKSQGKSFPRFLPPFIPRFQEGVPWGRHIADLIMSVSLSVCL